MTFFSRALSTALILAPLSLLPSAPARAAEFTLANELQPHLADLVPLYGPEMMSHPLVIEDPEETYFTAYNVIRMEGEIAPGDADRFSALYHELFESTGRYPYVLVMDSPGGNFLAGIELGERLGTEAYIDAIRLKAVIVLEGERCLSACALAFALAGDSEDNAPRMIETGGLVGFHMGILPEKTQRSQAEVGQIMGLTYDIMQSYLGLLRDGRNPLTLMLEALQHREAASFFLLGAEARAADLGFVPMARGPLAAPISAAALDLDTLGSLCNAAMWAAPGLVDEVSYDYWSNPGYQHEGGPASLTLASALAGPGDRLMGQVGNGGYCYAGIDAEGALRMQVGQDMSQSYETSPKTGEPVAAGWFHAGANTPAAEDLGPVPVALLAEALGCPGGVFARDWTRWMDDHHPETPAETRPLPPLPLKRAVTLRAEPGLAAEGLGEVPAGTQIEVQDCRLTGDNQAVWYRITDQGRTGWISARFASILGLESDQRPVVAHSLEAGR